MKGDRPSPTAMTVALALLLLSRHRRLAALVPPADAALVRRALRAAGGRAAALARAIDVAPPVRWVLRAVERALLPGFCVHIGLRKRVIDHLVRTALDSGHRQVVVIAAGLDPLATRLAREHPDHRLIELDHPATQEVKRGLLAGGGRPPNLILAPVDLAVTPVDEALANTRGYDAGLPTTFIVEGLLMYLTKQQVHALLPGLASQPCPSRRLVFTFMQPRSPAGVGFARQSRLADWWLARRAEPMTWALAPDRAATLARDTGWTLGGVLEPMHLREILAGLPPGPPIMAAAGECIAWALAGRQPVAAGVREWPDDPCLAARAVAASFAEAGTSGGPGQ